jgi:RimJ/RimL family protein N-acetyltransferase
MTNISRWVPRPFPTRETLHGRYVRLEPLDIERHGDGLYAIATAPDAPERFRWLFERPPAGRTEFQAWLENAQASRDPLHFVCLDQASGAVKGRQAYLRIDPAHGVIEIGSILWGPTMARTRLATEAFTLFARHAFDTLGYRRLEWKCNNCNIPSRRAAERFGFTFEGVFRQHMVVKGENRDTAWFSMLDHEWPRHARALDAWLDPGNFDEHGAQRRALRAVRAAMPR